MKQQEQEKTEANIFPYLTTFFGRIILIVALYDNVKIIPSSYQFIFLHTLLIILRIERKLSSVDKLCIAIFVNQPLWKASTCPGGLAVFSQRLKRRIQMKMSMHEGYKVVEMDGLLHSNEATQVGLVTSNRLYQRAL